MPGINVVKEYRKDSYYHIYNRGVNKTALFNSERDIEKFKNYIEEGAKRFTVNILKYGIAGNHFHIAAKQKGKRDIEKFMRSIGTRYAMYFNLNYERVGSLFQGVYRARLLKSEKELDILLEYIDKHKLQNGEVSDSMQLF